MVVVVALAPKPAASRSGAVRLHPRRFYKGSRVRVLIIRVVEDRVKA